MRDKDRRITEIIELLKAANERELRIILEFIRSLLRK